jgi:hypothetical protein
MTHGVNEHISNIQRALDGVNPDEYTTTHLERLAHFAIVKQLASEAVAEGRSWLPKQLRNVDIKRLIDDRIAELSFKMKGDATSVEAAELERLIALQEEVF